MLVVHGYSKHTVTLLYEVLEKFISLSKNFGGEFRCDVEQNLLAANCNEKFIYSPKSKIDKPLVSFKYCSQCAA